MNSAVSSGKIQLNKTNYFANLKKKANEIRTSHDPVEQKKFNIDLLNCIDILCNRIAFLEEIVNEMGKVMENDTEINERRNTIEAHLVAHVNAIEEAVGRDRVREAWDRQRSEEDEGEGGNEPENT